MPDISNSKNKVETNIVPHDTESNQMTPAERFNYNLMSADDFRTILETKSLKEVIVYCLELSEFNRRNPSQAPVIRAADIPLSEDGIPDLRTTQPWMWSGKRSYLSRGSLNKLGLGDLRRCLKFDKYTLAGGSVIKALLFDPHFEESGYEKADYDFYPIYNLDDGETRQEATEVAYREFCRECEEFFDNAVSPDIVGYLKSVVRGEHCTTIRTSQEQKIQMVHRGHPSPVSVVASFDQMCCRGFFDGHDIYLTVEAALCLYYQINPLDWRRESPTFLLRAQKYEGRGFRTIYPGLNVPEHVIPNVRLPGADLMYLDQMIYLEGGSPYCLVFDLQDAIAATDYEAAGWSCRAFTYGGLGRAIRQKQPIPYISADDFRVIEPGYGVVDVKSILESMINGFEYQGTSKYRSGLLGEFAYELMSLQKVMIDVILRIRGIKHECRIRLLSEDEMDEFSYAQQRTGEILDILAQRYDGYLEIQRKLAAGIEFEVDNPGKQFTGSFSPVIRGQPQDFWGERYEAFEYQTLYKMRKALWLSWKSKEGLLRWLPRDVFRMILRMVERDYFVPRGGV